MVPKWGQTYGCIQNQPCPTHLCSLPTVQISKYINKKYNNIHHLSIKFFFLNERNKKNKKVRNLKWNAGENNESIEANQLQ